MSGHDFGMNISIDVKLHFFIMIVDTAILLAWIFTIMWSFQNSLLNGRRNLIFLSQIPDVRNISSSSDWLLWILSFTTSYHNAFGAVFSYSFYQIDTWKRRKYDDVVIWCCHSEKFQNRKCTSYSNFLE